ncbi:hypothetical protein [Pseudomonas sp. SLFW]|uniref:hypothetical protein n=1 Tax=Pseudomonas sp. SLFW TaxID=2683259 RepID=UPI001413173C|nr:hypothetical protein [Pseudomonas sp. SLFW]NBB09567.1 hypothetical protein [Pseudomonas sp. SLFW]
MTDVQIYALIALVLTAGALVFICYRWGKLDGYRAGNVEGNKDARRDCQKTIDGMQTLLDSRASEHRKLRQVANWALARSSMGEKERATLLEIADHLQLSSDTFAALTSQSQARRSLDLRAKALDLADILRPLETEMAA